MRQALEALRLGPVATSQGRQPVAAHPGLWLQRMAPLPERGAASYRLSPEQKDALLDEVRQIPVPTIYRSAFARWRAALAGRCLTAEIELTSRLLIGHGEASPTEVGLTFHPTYGVPYLPGSALKGVLSHHIHASRGGDTRWRGPVFEAKDKTRAPLGDGSPVGAPGEWYAVLFGAPAVPTGEGEEPTEAKGYVSFEDALLVPSASLEPPLIRDVVTPHQVEYYNKQGRELPIDWDDPKPVGFLTIAPGARFLLGVGYAPEARAWAELALNELLAAIEVRGIGGKTSAGYGRARRVTSAAQTVPDGVSKPQAPATPTPAPVAPPKVERMAKDPVALKRLEDAVTEFGTTQEAKLAAFDRLDFLALVRAVHPDDAATAMDLIKKTVLQHSKIKRERGSVVQAIKTFFSDE